MRHVAAQANALGRYGAAIHNAGIGYRQLVLNVIVPWEVQIESRDKAVHGDYTIPLPANDERIVEGAATKVRYTRAERSYPEGNSYLYTVLVTLLANAPPRQCTLQAAVDGQPNVHLVRRAVIGWIVPQT